jgi:hypothetical protein
MVLINRMLNHNLFKISLIIFKKPQIGSIMKGKIVIEEPIIKKYNKF